MADQSGSNAGLPIATGVTRRCFVALAEAQVLPMLLVSIDGGLIIYANPAACRFYGRTLAQLQALTVDGLAVLPPAVLRDLRSQASRQGMRFHSRHRLADGDIRDVLVHSAPILIDGVTQLFSIVHDVSKHERTQRELRIQKEQLDILLNTAVSGYLEVDFLSGATTLSDGMRHLMGYAPHEPLIGGDTIAAIVHPHDIDAVRKARRQAIVAGIPFERRFRLRHKNGGHVWVHGSGRPLKDEGGRIVGFVGTVRDINLAVRLETDLRASEARYRTMFEASPLPMLVVDGRGQKILEANLAAVTLYGHVDDGLAQKPVSAILESGQIKALRALLSAESSDMIRSRIMRHRCANGRLIDVECHASQLTGEGRKTHLLLIYDLTERREAEAAIHRLVTCDMLTQLPNRESMLKRLHTDILRAKRGSSAGAVLALNIDSFRAINDAIGRDGGDLLLIEFAHRLREQVRGNDELARIGGDEFAILLDLQGNNALDVAAAAERTALRILDAVQESIRLQGRDYRMTATIGLAVFDGDSDSADTVLRQAEAALLRAKQVSRGSVSHYDPSMQEAIDLRASLEMDLREALDGEQFRVFYQVQVDQDGRPVGAEALLRWFHPSRGMVPPLQFIDLAEVTGMIVPLGRWVLEQACRQLVEWAHTPGYETMRLSVNVSARQFRQAEFVDDVRRVLEKTGADPARLVLELTESLLLDYAEQAAQRMHALRELGIGFSLDDFGTGYSSLAYLKDLPLDELKIDRTFTNDILVDASDAVIVRTMIGMARNLGLLLIAEGVETREQHEALVAWGCTGFQGYLFGRPVPIESFTLPEPLQREPRSDRATSFSADQPIPATSAKVAGTA
ncbi:MAG: EAL domain-containing protein [Burkholderiaceae bacterium]